MSDWRECELERIGGTIVEPAMRPENAVVAKIRSWIVRWDYEAGVHAERIEDFDRWAIAKVRCVPAAMALWRARRRGLPRRTYRGLADAARERRLPQGDLPRVRALRRAALHEWQRLGVVLDAP